MGIDEENKIRTLPADKFKEAELLEQQCSSFVDKLAGFKSNVQSLVDILSTQAGQIEKEKLKAVGQRLRVEMESDNRKRREHELKTSLAEKKAELERLQFYYQSLEKVEKEQRLLIEKLSNNEAS
eukprot:GDKI01021194.1.p1 GENE.GDKI01021194.1~~GDKI01021194.1.p1  ORF type:complete len:125 (-),score=39.98 GDKI01021194.1:92-466(-)